MEKHVWWEVPLRRHCIQRIKFPTIYKGIYETYLFGKSREVPYYHHQIISQLMISNKNSPYNYVPKPKLEIIANLDSWEQVLAISNNTVGKDITNS